MRLRGAVLALVLATGSSARACCPAPPPHERVQLASQEILIAYDTRAHRETFVRRAAFRPGRAPAFGFLVPTPAQPKLAEAPDQVFNRLRPLLEPRIEVRTAYEPDPIPLLLYLFLHSSRKAAFVGAAALEAAGVRVLDEARVGGYDATVLEADSATALSDWLTRQRFEVTAEIREWVRRRSPGLCRAFGDATRTAIVFTGDQPRFLKFDQLLVEFQHVPILPRHIAPAVLRALKHSPVVLVAGARQVGKSTLAVALTKGPWRARYVTLDDRGVLDAALRDPDGFLEANPAPLVIDEVQRAPDLLRAIKLRVDRRRRPGQYLLSGSANVLTLHSVSERLSGRVSVFQMEPFSWRELEQAGAPNVLEILARSRTASHALKALGRLRVTASRGDIESLIVRGGYPIPSRMRNAARRRDWFRGYHATYIERDIRDLAAIERLPDFSRLLSVLALRTGQLVNFADLGRDTGLPAVTLRRYCNLLETTYQLFYLQPYFTNLTKRITKTPKVYLSDSGLACYLSGADTWGMLERQARVGALLETWVACELRRQLHVTDSRPSLYFWRSHDGYEVDFVLEWPGRDLLGIEVKWASTVSTRDLAGLRTLREQSGAKLGLGIVAYGGQELVGLDSGTLAVPLPLLLGPTS